MNRHRSFAFTHKLAVISDHLSASTKASARSRRNASCAICASAYDMEFYFRPLFLIRDFGQKRANESNRPVGRGNFSSRSKFLSASFVALLRTFHAKYRKLIVPGRDSLNISPVGQILNRLRVIKKCDARLRLPIPSRHAVSQHLANNSYMHF